MLNKSILFLSGSVFGIVLGWSLIPTPLPKEVLKEITPYHIVCPVVEKYSPEFIEELEVEIDRLPNEHLENEAIILTEQQYPDLLIALDKDCKSI